MTWESSRKTVSPEGGLGERVFFNDRRGILIQYKDSLIRTFPALESLILDQYVTNY